MNTPETMKLTEDTLCAYLTEHLKAHVLRDEAAVVVTKCKAIGGNSYTSGSEFELTLSPVDSL